MKNLLIKKIIILICLCLAAVSAGCIHGTQNAETRNNVGIVLYDETDAFLSSLLEHYTEEAEKYSLNISTAGAHRSQLTENQLVNDMIADGADILCVNLVDRTNTSAIIKAAESADVPVIFFNREPVESDLKRWEKLYYVGADAAESGRLQGEIAISYMKNHPETDRNHDGIIAYYMLEGETGHQDAIIRSESSVEALRTAGIALAKSGYSICNWNRNEAYNAVLSLIQDQVDIELLLCNNDEMAAGAVEAYDNQNIPTVERPVIIGIDGTKTGLELVQNGEIAGTVFNDYIGQADTMLDMTINLLNGKTMTDDRTRYLPYQKVTVENVDAYIDLIS